MINLLFAADTVCNKNTFIFLPHWWEYLKTSTDDPLNQCIVHFHFPNDFLAVGLAVVDILLRLTGFVAVIVIIVAGIQHLFTGGNPEKAASARRRLFGAIIGLAIALTATAIVTFLGNQLSS